MHFVSFFFQAEAGIRVRTVTGVQRVLFRSSFLVFFLFFFSFFVFFLFVFFVWKSVVLGKGVDLGVRRIIKKKTAYQILVLVK